MKFLLLVVIALISSPCKAEKKQLTVGSKIFTENYILAEAMSQLLESEGFHIERKFGLGGTLVAYEALVNAEIDIYPEYTGTISEVILHSKVKNNFDDLNKNLKEQGLEILGSFGFSNSYSLAVREETAKSLEAKNISDLEGKRLKAFFPHEFHHRKDGWVNLKKAYDLPFKVKSVDHSLMFEAISAQNADIIVAYETDGKIKKLNLRVLKDDKDFFPKYYALPLIRSGLSPNVHEILLRLQDQLSEEDMRRYNALVEEKEMSFQQAARLLLEEAELIQPADQSAELQVSAFWTMSKRITKLAAEHVYLVLISTLCATFVAVPLGLLLFRFKPVAPIILNIVGLLQTVPSLALLVYMIPWLGVTTEPAMMALFLYSLLPILQNTYSGLQNVDPNLIQAAQGIGLYRSEILFTVQLPLALPIIMAGIRIATVINVGTATIAAFIGSGGLGELIVQGLSLNDISLMQQGAVPAAVLAILMNLAFGYIEKNLVKI